MLGDWKRRRRYMLGITIFCAAVIAFCLIKGVDTVTSQHAVDMAFITLISITGAYVFGATWDDKNKMDAIAKSTDSEGMADMLMTRDTPRDSLS